jgi:hypothetical protein
MLAFMDFASITTPLVLPKVRRRDLRGYEFQPQKAIRDSSASGLEPQEATGSRQLTRNYRAGGLSANQQPNSLPHGDLCIKRPLAADVRVVAPEVVSVSLTVWPGLAGPIPLPPRLYSRRSSTPVPGFSSCLSNTSVFRLGDPSGALSGEVASRGTGVWMKLALTNPFT